MTERRWPWLVSATLLLAAGVVAAWSVYRHWLPCRGAMLNGSLVQGYTYDREFSPACLRRMDGGMPFLYPFDPGERTAWALELGVLATVLAGLAWLVVVLGSTCSLWTKAFAAVPGLLTVGLAGYVVLAVERLSRDFDTPMGLGALIELLTFVVVVGICLDEPLDGWTAAALVIVAWGATSLAGIHQMAEYLVMSTFSDANWDVPPGTGYLTAAGLVLAGALTLAYAVRIPGPARRRDRAERTLVGRPA